MVNILLGFVEKGFSRYVEEDVIFLGEDLFDLDEAFYDVVEF